MLLGKQLRDRRFEQHCKSGLNFVPSSVYPQAKCLQPASFASATSAASLLLSKRRRRKPRRKRRRRNKTQKRAKIKLKKLNSNSTFCSRDFCALFTFRSLRCLRRSAQFAVRVSSFELRNLLAILPFFRPNSRLVCFCLRCIVWLFQVREILKFVASFAAATICNLSCLRRSSLNWHKAATKSSTTTTDNKQQKTNCEEASKNLHLFRAKH